MFTPVTSPWFKTSVHREHDAKLKEKLLFSFQLRMILTDNGKEDTDFCYGAGHYKAGFFQD